MWIYLPNSIDDQKELVRPIVKVDKEILVKQNKIKTLQRLKKSLMQNLLTGKKRINLNKFQELITP